MLKSQSLMRKIKYTYIAFILFVTLILSACSESVPSGVLDADQMEDVLYDMHLSHYLDVRVQDDGSFRDDMGAIHHAYFLSILDKHGVTQKEWDNSLRYYAGHAVKLKGIYNSLCERMESDAISMGVSTSGDDEGINLSDSTNIWRSDKQVLLTTKVPNTTSTWKMDIMALKGKRLQLSFVSMFLNESVQKKATVGLIMKLSNDSIVTTTQTVSINGLFTLSLADTDSLGIKELRGFFMIHQTQMYGDLPQYENDRNTTQILSISDIRLDHTPVEPRPVPVAAPTPAAMPDEPIRREPERVKDVTPVKDNTIKPEKEMKLVDRNVSGGKLEKPAKLIKSPRKLGLRDKGKMQLR